MTSKQWIILVVVAVVFAGGGFFGGIKYQQTKTPAGGARLAFTRGAGGPGGFGGRGGNAGSFVNGQVLSVDSNTITVKNMTGGSQVVVLAPSTQYRKAVDGSASDVTTGSMITVTGTSNSDGSLTAQNVQIRTGSSTPQGLPPQ